MNEKGPEHEIGGLSPPHNESNHKPKKPGEFRNFLKGAFKIALAIIIASLVIAGIAAVIVILINSQQEARNRNLAEVKVWEEITVPTLQKATFKLFTKWQDNNMYYQLHVDGFPREVQDEFDKKRYNRNLYAGFTIVFLDITGFKVDSINIPLRSMSRIVKNEGGYSGLSIKDTHYMSADEYRKITMWEITWSL